MAKVWILRWSLVAFLCFPMIISINNRLWRGTRSTLSRAPPAASLCTTTTRWLLDGRDGSSIDLCSNIGSSVSIIHTHRPMMCDGDTTSITTTTTSVHTDWHQHICNNCDRVAVISSQPGGGGLELVVLCIRWLLSHPPYMHIIRRQEIPIKCSWTEI